MLRGRPGPEEPLGVAVSGGGDSLALLLLAQAAFPGCVRAVTIDHGLRDESDAEAQRVAAICADLDVPHDIITLDGAGEFTGNLQEQARAARYAAIGDWAGSGSDRRVPWVAIAHQLDDVAEGFLMRARRGAGVGGLAAMVEARPIGSRRGAALLVRPLLGWRRTELAAIVESAGLTPISDPSNIHPRFDRSRIRALISESEELPPERLALSARNLRDAETALDWAAEREWRDRAVIERHESVSVDMADLPHELRRRLARRAIDYLRREAGSDGLWRGTGLDRMVRALESEKAATLAGVAVRPGRRWLFRAAPPRRSH